MANNSELGNEIAVHGRRWQTVHDGYFFDSDIALPFLSFIRREISNSYPNVIADFGGGGGFILSELAKRHPENSIKYVNIDISAEQLQECKYEGICSLKIPVEEATRELLVNSNDSLMIIMRSLLHYFGQEGIAPFLIHLREQMKQGEIMIHQTACFDFIEDADCANHLYTLMRTNKWYPTVKILKQILAETGWEVLECKPAPGLCLKSSELGERYGLSKKDITQITKEIGRKYNRKAVFVTDVSNFTAYLHYRIFLCRAI